MTSATEIEVFHEVLVAARKHSGFDTITNVGHAVEGIHRTFGEFAVIGMMASGKVDTKIVDRRGKPIEASVYLL